MLVGVLLAWSPGKPQPMADKNGRPLGGNISEKIHVAINGVEQRDFTALHNSMFEELEKMQKILQKDVLIGGNTLADAK